MKYKNNIREDIRKSRPILSLPLLQSLTAILLVVVLIIFKAFTDSSTWPLVITGIVVVISLTIATWIFAYFSRKKRVEILKDYEKETKIFTDFIKAKKNYRMIQLNENDFSVTYEETIDDLPKFKFNQKTGELGSLDYNNTFISFGIGFGGLEINPKNKRIINVKGVLVKSIWQKKKLILPVSKKATAKLYLNNGELSSLLNIQVLVGADTYYDKKLGYICIGEYKNYGIDEAIEIVEGCILVLREGKIVSYWLNVGPDIILH